MLFFKGKNKKQGQDSTISSNDLLNQGSTPDENAEANIETELSIHPMWAVPNEKLYVLRYLNNECPPLKPNQLSLAGIEINEDAEGNFVVAAFVRNSLESGIKLEETPLLLLDADGTVVGRKAFNLAELGEIPARSSRPWNFIFTKKDLLTDTLPKDGWKLAFELKKKHQLDLAESWEKSLAEADKNNLRELMNKIDPPKQGEVNFLGLQAQLAEDGQLRVTLLVRNGSDKNVKIEKLPLIVEDAAGDTVAQGGFELDHFEVKSNTSKPWTFIFPANLVAKKDPDFSRWKAYPPQK